MDRVRRFVKSGKFSYTFVLDTNDEVSNHYHVTAIPTSFFISKDGIISQIIVGEMTEKQMETALAKALK